MFNEYLCHALIIAAGDATSEKQTPGFLRRITRLLTDRFKCASRRRRKRLVLLRRFARVVFLRGFAKHIFASVSTYVCKCFCLFSSYRAS